METPTNCCFFVPPKGWWLSFGANKEMKNLFYRFSCGLFVFGLLVIPTWTKAQNQTSQRHSQGSFFIFWGWNGSAYSKSDIHFQGEGYDFKLKKVKATDRQSPFSWETYFHPANMTIPQYNFRVGYFIKDNWSIAFGVDHMKYVVTQNQRVAISGEINGTGTDYDGHYILDEVTIEKGFLEFEHTDGLNYIATDLIYSERFWFNRKWEMAYSLGGGLGVVMPRTNTTLLNMDRYDQFHFAGWGTNIEAGLECSFSNFFTRANLKLGYINMPDIRTTPIATHRASQSFFFEQFNVVFGWKLPGRGSNNEHPNL